MNKSENLNQPVVPLNFKNGSQSSRYKSMDQINDVVDSSRTGRKMDAQQERRTIAQWTRDDIEDKYLRLMDDYQVLKSHARQQETKITSLATKLRKLTDDVKKKENVPTNVMTMKEDLDNYRLKAEMAESQNQILKGKIQLLQGQLMSESKRQTVYDGVPSRINSGIAKRQTSAPGSRRQSNMRVLKPVGETYALSTMSSEQEPDGRNMQLTKILDGLHEDLREKDRTIQHLSNKLQQEQNGPREKKSKIDENIELINLNKAMNEKRSQMEEMRARYADLETKQRQLERTNYELIDEIERLQKGVPGYSKTTTTEPPSMQKRRIQELEAIVGDYKREVAVLKETNEKLTNSAFDAEREHEWREKEKRYRTQLAQLELTQKRDIGEKGSVLERLGKERDIVDNMEREISKLQVEKYELEIRLREKDDKLRVLNKQGNVSSEDIEEAIMLVQNKRGTQLQSTPDLAFLQKVDKESDKDLSRRFQDLELNHAETIQELEKTRSLLQTQYKFTNNYKQESEKLADRLEELRRDYEERLNTYARLLDIRAARIQKLEAQMKDVAYGTKTPMVDEVDNYAEMEPPVMAVLERGENLLEVHIGRVCMTKEAVEKIGDAEPFLFGTWDFYDFETQATGLIRGTSPEFDIKAEYLVKIDDFFLNYLYKNSFLFELHQAIGTEFVTLASCQLTCKEIMDRPVETTSGRVGAGSVVASGNGLKYHCKARLIGVRDDLMEVNMGVLEYWVRLKHPMDQVIRQYREKLKAEGYIMANEKSIMEAQMPSERPAANMNELIIRVLRCDGIKSRQKDVQPSPYLCYKFYDFGEQVSPTITSSNRPEFHDLKRFPVQMDSSLHQYLKTQTLKVYLIDDLDPDTSKYLGIASVPLIPLSNNKKIIGSFELYDNSKKKNGTMDLEMEWMYSYLYSDNIDVREDDQVSMLPGEIEDLNNKTPVKETPTTSLSKSEDKKPSVKARKQPKPQVEEVRESDPPMHEEIKETLSGPQKSILKKTPRSSTGKKNVLETLSDKDIQDLLTMTDTQDLTRKDSPRDDVHEDFTLSQSLPKNQKIKDNLAASLERLDHAPQKVDSPKSMESKSEDKPRTSGDGVKIPTKTPRSPKTDSSGTSMVPGDSGAKTVTMDTDVVMSKPQKKKPKSKNDLNPDEISVEIHNVEIENNCDILKDNSVKLLYAAYRIPGIHSEDTESSSLAKPSASQSDKKMSFNFRKTFDVSFDRNYTVRQHIAVMLTEDSKKDIVFNLIKEPDNDDDDCEDIGVARLDVREILRENKNIENRRIPIYNLKDSKKLMGHMEVTVNMLGVFKAIERELKND